ncbi:MAG: DinB family protein [Chloroflexota bacterium]|nr:MAG: DinB family protein [Chloroflexota bacterium]
MPRRRWVEFSASWLAWAQDNLLAAVRSTTPEHAHQRVGPHAPSIAFHAWHMARWADKHQAALPAWLAGRAIPGPAAEIWVRDGFAVRWGMADLDTGDHGGTGVGLDDDVSAALPLPDVPELLAYLEAAFGAFLEGIRAIDDDEALDLEIVDHFDEASTIGDAIADATSHTDRHLGMIEALRGVLGERGTVTV